MKRHPALQTLSREHHHALKLARDARLAAVSGDESAVRSLSEHIVAWLAGELAAHFDSEERDVLPALACSGEQAAVARTLVEHAELRRLGQLLQTPDATTLMQFAELMNAHVRFEERELFELAQAGLPAPLPE
ncbi:hemerythrin domain-containing protein [Chitinivorax sp. PXF-14]|uniref:hemerythrin domain-containing protein n=1 Tax=Chitinivorax sp. PXF-14 TaxID=3230488 RepID=UPI003466C188